MRYETTLNVDPDIADQMELECSDAREGAHMKMGTVLFDEEVRFSNGYRMAIQVCTSPGQSCWTQGVVFDPEGNERGCTDVGESFAGEYHVWADGDEYVVEVVPLPPVAENPDDFCGDQGGNYDGYVCTRPTGHKGDHIAHDMDGDFIAGWGQGQPCNSALWPMPLR